MEPSATPVVSQRRQLAVPDQHVPADPLPLFLGEGDELVGRGPVVGAAGGLELSHFITFSGVTEENWSAVISVYFAFVPSRSGLTAVPMRSPTLAARARNESAG